MGDDDAPWLRPAIWGPAVLLLVAALVYLLPAGWLPSPPWRHATASTEGESQLSTAPAGASPLAASAPVAIAASETTGVAASMPEAAASIAAATAPAASTAGGADAASSAPTASASVEGMGDAVPQATAPGAAAGDADHALVLHVTSDSWIEVIDGRGQALLARTVKPGESIGLDGALPLRLRIGNAPATAVVFRGQPVALAPYTRDNLARLELR